MRLVALLSVLNAATQPKRNEIEFRFDADDQWLETATLLGAVGPALGRLHGPSNCVKRRSLHGFVVWLVKLVSIGQV